MTVVETPSFVRDAKGLLSDEELTELISFVAANPESGDLMRETGGIRKIRWAVGCGGKRGGVRVVYYHHNESIPLFLLNVFAKNEKSNLTKAERNQLRELTRLLVAGYQGRFRK